MLVPVKGQTALQTFSRSIGMAILRDWPLILGRWLERMFSPYPRSIRFLIAENRYPNRSLWITEYALNNDTLANTQGFFNTSAEYFDRISYIERYSYFGAFRSSVSNVGPNVAMLTQNGQLTDIGSWYLGGAATNNIPSATGFGVRVVPGIGAIVAALMAGLCVL
jgi:Glycosyl hydrolase catalytic core